MKSTLSPQEVFATANVQPTTCLFCKPNPGMVIYETANFHVLRDNFPITPGHIMISSKLHYGSLGELDSSVIPELENLKHRIDTTLKSLYGNTVYYEHGRAGSCHAVSSPDLQCEHFHLHCLPISVCIHKNIAQYASKSFEINNLGEITELFGRWGEYLYFENNQKEACYYPVRQVKIPPHFLRSLICATIARPEKANWQAYQVYGDFLESFKLTSQIVSHLETNYDLF